MSNATTFVGLDVHARSVKACAFVPETGETVRRSFGYEPCEIASWASSLPQPAKCVYESGVTGFHLCRELRSMGVGVSVNIIFTIFANVFSPIAPTRMRRIRQRGCAAFGA